MTDEKILSFLNKDVKSFYEHEGKNIYERIIGKYNDNSLKDKDAIYLLKWCYENFNVYYVDDGSGWCSYYVNELIDNNLDIFIPFDVFSLFEKNVEKAIYIIQDDLYSKLDIILKKYYKKEEMEEYNSIINDINYKIVVTQIEREKFIGNVETLGNEFGSEMFEFSCYCHTNFINYAVITYKSYIKQFLGFDYDEIYFPWFHIERINLLKILNILKTKLMINY